MTAAYFEQGRNPVLASDQDAVTLVHTQKVIVSGISTVSVTAFQGYPTGAVPLNASTGNKAATAGTATLANGGDGTTVYVTGFEVTGAGASSAANVLVTLTGSLGGTMTYVVAVPGAATTGIAPLIVEFPTPVPASAVDTSIVLNLPSFGSGNTNAAGVIHGYRV